MKKPSFGRMPVIAGAMLLFHLPLLSPAMAGDQSARPSPFPEVSPGGWHPADTARTYDGDELYRLIDGGADLYFEYGFRSALATTYADTGGRSIKAELYEMQDAQAAFGLYSLQQRPEGRPLEIADEGVAFGDYVVLWRGRSVLFLSSEDTGSVVRSGMESLAAAISGLLEEAGSTPALLRRLPKDGLAAARFVKGPLGLAVVHAFGAGDLFGRVECAVGSYPDHLLFLFRYASEKEADSVLAVASEQLSQTSRYLRRSRQRGIVALDDRVGGELRLAVVREMLVAVVAAKGAHAAAIQGSVLSSLRQGR